MLPKILTMKRYDVSVVHEIDERVASVAFVLEIDGEIEKVDLAWAMAVVSEL